MSGPRPDVPVLARIERLLAVPPDVIYRAWTEPTIMARWMSPFGRAEVSAVARRGGRLLVVMIEGDVRIEHVGEYLEAVPPRRLSFTWRSPYTGAEPSVVTVELVPRGSSTLLVLTHERLPGDVVESHESGWRTMVARLDEVLGRLARAEELVP